MLMEADVFYQEAIAMALYMALHIHSSHFQ